MATAFINVLLSERKEVSIAVIEKRMSKGCRKDVMLAFLNAKKFPENFLDDFNNFSWKHFNLIMNPPFNDFGESRKIASRIKSIELSEKGKIKF